MYITLEYVSQLFKDLNVSLDMINKCFEINYLHYRCHCVGVILLPVLQGALLG